MKLGLLFKSCVLAIGLCLTMPVSASSLQVSPTGLDMRANQTSDALTLTNTGSAPVRAQVQVFLWRQVDGKDVLEPTRDIVATPAMLNIAPGTKQLVRVVRLTPPSDNEGTYRVIVSELPAATPQGSKAGLTFLLKYSLPVFIAPVSQANAIQPKLTARAHDAVLEVANTGRQHARLSQVWWVGPGNQRRELNPGLLGYVLPGETMRWPIPAAMATGNGHFEAVINDDHDATALPPSSTP